MVQVCGEVWCCWGKARCGGFVVRSGAVVMRGAGVVWCDGSVVRLGGA